MTRDFEDQDLGPTDEPMEHEDAHADVDDRHDEEQEAGGEGRRDRERRPRLDSFEKMKVWQEAHALTLKVFAMTPTLPAEQQGGLALQMEQAAVSVPRSIAEGFKRRGPRNKAHFYNMAQTGLEGLRYYFILCRDLKFDLDYDNLSRDAEQISRMLDGLVRSMMR